MFAEGQKDYSIHICYALYDNTGKYSKIAATSMISVFENTDAWITIHLLHDDSLTEGNRKKFIRLARKYGNHINFYNVAELESSIFEKIKAKGMLVRYSPGSFYRLLIMRVLPDSVGKVIYLDCDTIVNLDISKLYQEDIGKNVLAAVPEVEAAHGIKPPLPICDDGTVSREKYFNSGILLIDMEQYRQYNNLLEDGLNLLNQHPEYLYFDQDILNYFFSDNYRKLPGKYDSFVDAASFLGIYKTSECINHYVSNSIDTLQSDNPYIKSYFHYYLLTPWFDENAFLQLAVQSLEYIDEGRMYLQKILFSLPDKAIICYGNEQSKEAVKNIFNIKDEQYCNIYNQQGTEIEAEKLLTGIKKHKGKISFFFINNFYKLVPYIEKMGLKKDCDFFDGMPLLATKQGGKRLNGYKMFFLL